MFQTMQIYKPAAEYLEPMKKHIIGIEYVQLVRKALVFLEI